MTKKWYKLTLLTSKYTGYYPDAYLKNCKGVWKYVTEKGEEIEEWKVTDKEKIEHE